ncbi:MAG: STAS domain-containing protein [Phycisphaerae bacterium]|nr:STAS domain-containing protein [Phycisphaerae bacterium]
MPKAELVISQIQNVTVVNFQETSILDTATVEAIAKELYTLVDEQARRKIVLDFHAVRFLSSQMIGVLIAMDKKSKSIGGKLVICGLRPELHKVFKITKLDKLLTFAADEEASLNSFDVFTQP